MKAHIMNGPHKVEIPNEFEVESSDSQMVITSKDKDFFYIGPCSPILWEE